MNDEPKPAADNGPAKPPRWKRLLKRTAIVLAVLTLCAAYALKDHIRTLNSLGLAVCQRRGSRRAWKHSGSARTFLMSSTSSAI